MILAPGVFIAGVVIFLIVIWDAFEAIILPRRVTRKFRLTRFFFQFTWSTWKIYARLIPSKKRRDSFLGFYGPISLLFLIGVWAAGLILSFAMMQYGAGSAVNLSGGHPSFNTDMYLSGTTFFTLGLGDVVPRSGLSRFLVVVESGFGFGFLAAVIGYLPFIYGSFADRETEIVLLDARAGAPPTGGELLLRHTFQGGHEELRKLFKDWERWSAQVLESHLSYPVLAYFRSQHDNQSWISSLTAILDACALTISGMEDVCARQAQLTFAIARHAVADLCQVFSVAPHAPNKDRLPPEVLQLIRETLAKHGTQLSTTPEALQKLTELRNLYEPYLFGLAQHFNLLMPGFVPAKKSKDNWQTTAWAKTTNGTAAAALVHDDHF
ncbi:MAG TPA: potassium channel family protein [Candidatus Baltobacteraceae bacterium]|nr:potassium channel family protein [Candidatus Baltobacteraceae bacterium]